MSRKLKKEKIDVHPERVQNPYEKLKRSPGKFDQRVFMEQDLYGANVNKFYHRIYSTQQHVQITGFDKKIAEMRRRSTELKTQAEEITYLNTLRAALRKEMHKREEGIHPATRVHIPTMGSTDLLSLRATTMPAVLTTDKKETKAGNSLKEIPAAVAIETVAEINKESQDPTLKPIVDTTSNDANDSMSITTTSSDLSTVKKTKRKGIQEKRPITPSRLSTLESMSFEIMTNTLPVNKLKRIIPEEQLPVHEKWPVLSNYRKKKVLPSVKEGKQQLMEDMGDLHVRLNKYFDCDNFPLTQYKYVAKAYPRKYRLLKAIETENLSLPVLPK